MDTPFWMTRKSLALPCRNPGGIDALNPILEVSWGRKDDNRALPKKCKVTGLGLEDTTRIYIYISGWWFQIFFIFIPTWGNDPI